MKVCAILMSPGKLRRFDAQRMCETNSTEELRFIQLSSVEQLFEVKVNCIIHKLPELLSFEDGENAVTRHFQRFVDQNPQVVCIDPLKNIQQISRRDEQFSMISHFLEQSVFKPMICVPNFCVLPTNDVSENIKLLQQAKVRFPIIVKPQAAHGEKDAHGMALVFNESGLDRIPHPAVAQEFINHNGKLFKIFVIGSKTFVFIRNSIRNLTTEGSQDAILFDSRTVSKNEHNSPLCDMNSIGSIVEPGTTLNREWLDRIAALIRQATGLDLFGVDVIECVQDKPDIHLASPTPKWAVIDVNVCPGYDKVPSFHKHLENLVREKLDLPLIPVPDES